MLKTIHFVITDCMDPLGLEDGTISNEQLSTEGITWWYPWMRARDNWQPSLTDLEPWLQIDLRQRTIISGVRLGWSDGVSVPFKIAYSPYINGYKGYKHIWSSWTHDTLNTINFVMDENGASEVSVILRQI